MQDPTDPFSQLARSHRRLEQELDALRVAAEERDVEALRRVLAFFGRQVARHEEDEEASLFPRLRAKPEAAQLEATVAQLEGEHRRHEAAVRKLAEAIDTVEGGSPGNIVAIAEEMIAGYDGHIALEERELFPEAKRLLSEEERAEIVREMQARRG
jgi:hemerythrin-like domain-containing protein